MQNNFNSLGYYIPELVLVLTAVFVILSSLNSRTKGYVFHVSFGGVSLSLISLLLFHSQLSHNMPIFLNLLVYDSFSFIAKIIFLVTTLLIFVNSRYDPGIEDSRKPEFYMLIVIIVVGLFAMSTSVNLVMIYLAIELVSIPSYLITGFVSGSGERESNEASLKYVLYGAFASALMVFGMTWLYGLTGSLYLYDIGQLLWGVESNITLVISMLLIMVGFGYKISIVPFHYWAPDVYQGAPLSVTAFLSVAPKVAGITLIVRFFYTTLTSSGDPLALHPLGWDWTILFAVLSAITMTVGNVIAIQQSNVRRLLAYSSISHMGFVLIGMSVVDGIAVLHMHFYLILYMFMILGAFFVVQFVERYLKSNDIEEWAGIGYKYPLLSAMMAINLIALSGLPPTSGFVIKFYLLASLIQSKTYFWLAIVAVLNTVVALYYYFRIVRVMYLDEEKKKIISATIPRGLLIMIVILSSQGLLFYFYWSPLYSFLIG